MYYNNKLCFASSALARYIGNCEFGNTTFQTIHPSMLSSQMTYHNSALVIWLLKQYNLNQKSTCRWPGMTLRNTTLVSALPSTMMHTSTWWCGKPGNCDNFIHVKYIRIDHSHYDLLTLQIQCVGVSSQCLANSFNHMVLTFEDISFHSDTTPRINVLLVIQ